MKVVLKPKALAVWVLRWSREGGAGYPEVGGRLSSGPKDFLPQSCTGQSRQLEGLAEVEK